MIIGETVIAATAGGLASVVSEVIGAGAWYNTPDDPELPVAVTATDLTIDLRLPAVPTESVLTMRTV